jgi:PKD repeat protein
MRRARHRSLALALGLVLSLAFAGAAAAADFTHPAWVNPNQNITVTPVLSAAEQLDAQTVHFRFSDTEELLDQPPFDGVTFPGYATAGVRSVTMQVEYLLAADDFIPHDIRVNAAPVAAFSRNVSVPNVGQSVTFDAGATTDDQEVPGTPGGATLPGSAYDWDFDNNGSYETSGSVVQRSFATPGDKLVRLRVTDSGDRTDTAIVTVHVNRPPVAAIVFSPRAPVVGQSIEFASVSSDPDSPISLVEWDLDGDGQYDDARGDTTARAFGNPGSHTVRLRVRDTLGRIDTVAVSFSVAALPVISPPKRMNPWPWIRTVGYAGLARVRLDLFTVRAIEGATVRVRCVGRSCPRRKAVSTRARGPLVRVRWLERRLRVGTRIYVSITYPGTIGRYERITLRRKKKPRRHMSCLYPNDPQPRKC